MNNFKSKTTINCKGSILKLDKSIVMGIINITPDSFYDGGKHSDIKQISNHIQRMIDDGATIIDVGAYSSRPGAKHISEKEELQRLIPVLDLLRKKFPNIIVSVDTFRSIIADQVIKNYGVAIINDISAGEMDKNMFETVALHNIPYIMMHMQGSPQNMQTNPIYKNVTAEIIKYFTKKLELLKKLGMHDIIVDPGFGFGKTLEHNYQLLSELEQFKLLELPILVGISRKSMIYKLLNCIPDDALNGTTALNMFALSKGASILRVHDVKEAKQVVDLYLKLNI